MICILTEVKITEFNLCQNYSSVSLLAIDLLVVWSLQLLGGCVVVF